MYQSQVLECARLHAYGETLQDKPKSQITSEKMLNRQVRPSDQQIKKIMVFLILNLGPIVD